MSREGGRHRLGLPWVRVEPGNWDVAKRAAAAQLDQLEPAWHIMYGLGSRRFHAIATWNTPRPVHLQAATVEELRELMREAELDAMTRPGRPRGWVA